MSDTYWWFNTKGRSKTYARRRLLFLLRIHSSGVRCEFLPKPKQELAFSKHCCGSSVCNIYLGCKKTSFRFPFGLQGSEALRREYFLSAMECLVVVCKSFLVRKLYGQINILICSKCCCSYMASQAGTGLCLEQVGTTLTPSDRHAQSSS